MHFIAQLSEFGAPEYYHRKLLLALTKAQTVQQHHRGCAAVCDKLR
jgi:hypothetical protein